MPTIKENYSADNIKVLDDVSHIRLRRGMYIGESGDPRQLLSEIFDNAIDEVQAGYSTELIVNIDTAKNKYTVRDYGRGIPHGMKTLENGEKKEVLEVLMTKANSGGKFDNNSYNYSSGLNGLGLTITNALSKSMTIASYRNGKFVKVEAINATNITLTKGKTEEKTGTEVIFIPDDEMFKSAVIPVDFIEHRCKIASALGFRARLIIDGTEIDTNSKIFDLITEEDNKIVTYVDIPEIEVENELKEKMKVALRYTSDTKDRYFGFTNLLSNYLGGTHVQLLAKTIVNTWTILINKYKNLRPAIELKQSDYLVGLRGICAVFIAKPEFSSQTKEKLVVNKTYFDDIMENFSKALLKYLTTNIDIAQQLIKRFEEYRLAQNALLSRKEISSLIKVNDDSSDNIRRRSVVSKLVECTSKKRTNTELFIVEGDSACLRADTLIRLSDDTEDTIKNICERVQSGEILYVYGKQPKGKPNTGPNVYKILNGGVTRKNAALYRVYIDNGTYVDCTADHKFMLTDRSFKEAKDLTPQDSLSIMTYHRERFKPTNNHIYQDIYCKYNKITEIPKGYVVHHKDFNHFNNTPSNLVLMSISEHVSLHNLTNEGFKKQQGNTVHLKAYWKNPENKIIQSLKVKERFMNKDERIKASTATKLGMSKLTKQQHTKRLSLQAFNVSLAYYKDLIYYRKLFTIDSIFNKDAFKLQKKLDNHNHANGLYLYPEKFISKYNIETVSDLNNLILQANHRITRIDCLNTYEDVYDIEVDEVHNFCLANDVIVHNCGPYLYVRDKETQAVLPIRGKILNTTYKDLKEVIQNKEICDIANSIGCGIGAQCDASKSRYDKIIISADADPDGLQINCLVLAVFVNLFPDMIKQGRVYISIPPLYCWGKSVKDYGWCNKVEDIPANSKDVHRFKGYELVWPLRYFPVITGVINNLHY